VSLSQSKIDEVIAQLEDYLKENENNKEVSQNLIGLSIGYSGAVLSGFKKGTYTGDIDSVARGLIEYFDQIRQKQLQPMGDVKFVKTNNAQKVFKLAEYVRINKKIGLLQGRPGTGKTVAIKEYLKLHPRTTTVIEATYSIESKALLMLLCNEFNLSREGRSHDLLMRLVERLKDTNHLLFIDEGEYLPYKALEQARRLADFTNIGLILSGTKKLMANLKGHRAQHVQLWSRIGIVQELGPLTDKEAKLIIENNLIGVNGLWEVIYSYSKKNARVLGHLIDLIKYMANKTNKPITEELIMDAANQLIMNVGTSV